MSVDRVAIRRRISLVAVCSRSRDSSCSVRRCTSFLSWRFSVACGLFFFFETPTLAMWVLLTPNLEDFQTLTVKEGDQKAPWSESLVDNGVRCQPLRKPNPSAIERTTQGKSMGMLSHSSRDFESLRSVD